jgi:hypothetical protein
MRRALLLVAFVLPLAACGGGGGGSSSQGKELTPIAYVQSAAKRSAQATSEHVSVTGVATVQGQAVTLRGSGDFDNTKKAGSLHTDVNLGGLAATLDAVIDGTTFYLKSPLFSDTLPKGKSWIKLDLQKLGQTRGIDFSALLSQDPSQSFAQLQASGSVTKVGDETIDGVDTTHYRAKVDLAKLPQGQKIAALTKVRYAPYDVWIGKDDGYVYRVRTAYSYAVGGVRQSVSSTTSYSDFGKDVNVQVPSADESVDATKSGIKGLGG